jgi:hypothetical protein
MPSSGIEAILSVYRWAAEWKVWVRFPAVQEFNLLHSVQTDTGAHPAFYPMGTGDSFSPGAKWQGRYADHSPRSSAKVKNGGAVPPVPHMSEWFST